MADQQFEHALIIGGTGMLADTTRNVARHARCVTLVARNEGPMASLVGETQANCLGVDYTDVEAFTTALRHARATSGDYDLVVAWVHSVGGPALDALADLLDERLTEFRFVHVIGTRGADAPLPEFAQLSHVQYQRVLLGQVRDHGQTRWLTHEEISDGVWREVVSGALESIVGQLPG